MDESTYTGIDGVDMPDSVLLNNTALPESVQSIIDEKNKQIKELTPQLETLLNEIKKEKDLTIQFIADYVDNTKDDDEQMRGELKAAARYRKYLDGLATKFTMILGESKK